jgi:hypothetical protein
MPCLPNRTAKRAWKRVACRTPDSLTLTCVVFACIHEMELRPTLNGPLD